MGPERTEHDALPVHHIRPPSGWINDPNGPIRWRGRYHVFFQHNPRATVHHLVGWGHATSRDLVRWEYEPVALAPTPGGPDANGCWSGCVVDDGDVATAVYTGTAAGPDTATICIASASDDRLNHWAKTAEPVAQPPPDLPLLGFRDPFVFEYGGRRFAVVGAGGRSGGRAMALLYRCDDLRRWTYAGVLLDTTDAVAGRFAAADIWECPQLVEIGDHWVLLLSLVSEPHAERVAYLVGDLVGTDTGLRFAPGSGGLVDHGHDFYAPAVLRAGRRVLLWGWAWEDRPEEAVRDAGWAGVLTIARDLTLTDDRQLRSSPAAELAVLHGATQEITLSARAPRATLPSGPVDLLVHAQPGEGDGLTLHVRRDLQLHLDLAHGTAEVRRTVHEPRRHGWQTRGRFPPGGTGRRARIIIDGSIVEVFVEDGPAFTERVYAVEPATLALAGPEGARCHVVVRRLGSPEPAPSPA